MSKDDLTKLANSIKTQIESAYSFENKDMIVNTTVNISVAETQDQIGEKDHLFAVVNQEDVGKGIIADARGGGLLMRIGSDFVDDIKNNTNERTVPHELGHTAMLDHPHANASWVRNNPNADPNYEFVWKNNFKFNLMSQTWVVNKANIKNSDSKNLTNNQVRFIHLNYQNGKLNKNYHQGNYHGYKTLNVR